MQSRSHQNGPRMSHSEVDGLIGQAFFKVISDVNLTLTLLETLSHPSVSESGVAKTAVTSVFGRKGLVSLNSILSSLRC